MCWINRGQQGIGQPLPAAGQGQAASGAAPGMGGVWDLWDLWDFWYIWDFWDLWSSGVYPRKKIGLVRIGFELFCVGLGCGERFRGFVGVTV